MNRESNIMKSLRITIILFIFSVCQVWNIRAQESNFVPQKDKLSFGFHEKVYQDVDRFEMLCNRLSKTVI